MSTTATRSSAIGGLLIAGVNAILGLALAFGKELTGEQIAAIVSATGFVGIVLTLVLWTTTVPRETVVEHLIGPDVVAGPANDLVPTGATVREVKPRRAAEGDAL